ncbi:uncharacterized protein LOC110989897, partial [Acanthaster planci]|uniref:Uncharacterized protein LOC110989897 n=1 Tax=Acanthaster planci TaxID=133434 RepID=A0A8B7ZYW4_ACAPL
SLSIFFIPLQALPYCADRIRQRTSTTCVLDTADDWNEQFSRRQSHLSKGFFTPQHVAYKPIGDVDLDSRNLVFRVFSATLPKKVHAAAFFIGSHKLGFTPPKTAEKSEQSSKQHTPKALHDKHLGAQASQINQEAVSSAGFTYIKNYLQDSEKILVAERGGQNFEKCVADLEKARRQNENTGIQQTSVTFCPPSGSSFGVTLVPSSSHYTQVRSASTLSADSTKSDISTRTVSKTKPIDDDIEEELTRLNSLRNHRGLAEKLKAIHRLLNALHNMKSKDLRTRVPLSHEMVRFLYRHVPYERPVFSRLARTTGLQTTTTTAPMELIQSSDTVSSSDFNPSGANAPGTGTATTMNKWTSKSHLSNRSNASVKPPDVPPLSSTPVQWRKFRQNLSSLHHKSRPLDKEQRLETWEDLLAVQTSTVPSCGQQTHRFSLVSQGHAHPHTLGFSKWMAAHHRHHPERDHHHQALSTKQPYWITVAVSSADKVKRQVQTSSSSTQTDGMDPEKTLDTVRESFYKVKKKMAREVLTDIERMERERCRTFRQKFHAANEHPVMELAIKRMREAPQISRQLAVTEDSDMKEIKPSKW